MSKFYNDRIKLMMFIGFLFSGIGDILYLFVNSIWFLFAVQALVGLSVGLLNPAWDTLYSDDMEEGTAGSSWGLWTGGVNIFVGVATLLAGFVMKYLGFNYLFIFMALFDSIAIVYSFKILINKDI